MKGLACIMLSSLFVHVFFILIVMHLKCVSILIYLDHITVDLKWTILTLISKPKVTLGPRLRQSDEGQRLYFNNKKINF